MVAPKAVSNPDPRNAPKLQDLVAPPSMVSSYYVLLIVKILLILLILFTLPKLVTTETPTTMMLSTTKDRRRNTNTGSMNQHHIYKRYRYKLRSLRDDCQNNPNKPCALLIPEESLNCVNECISATCYQQVYHSTTQILENPHPEDDVSRSTTSTMIEQQQQREPLEDGEIDVVRAKEFDQCVMNELRQEQHQQPLAQRI